MPCFFVSACVCVCVLVLIGGSKVPLALNGDSTDFSKVTRGLQGDRLCLKKIAENDMTFAA